MPVTFNSNNNYDVEIITETNVTNPTIVQYSATTNTPFVEIKITPINSQSNPVLASNLKIDNIVPYFAWNAGVNYNVKGICEPPATPHGSNSSLQHVTGIGATSYCQATFGINSFYGNSNLPQQGPYEAQNDFVTQTNQIIANGVSWLEIILIEVYEDDLGDLINDNHSPAVAENYNEWLMWSGPVSTLGGTRREITTNVYPVYVKAFVYLSFDSGGLAGLTANTTLNLDIDEVEPTYGCIDPTADNYDELATVDDGSCILPINGCTDPNALNYDPLAIVDDGSCTYSPYSLPPFTFTFGPPGTLLQGQQNPNIIQNISYGGQIWALMSFEIDVQPVLNPLPNSGGVDYEITELYYIDVYGSQVNLNYIPSGGLMSPPYNLVGGTGPNILNLSLIHI